MHILTPTLTHTLTLHDGHLLPCRRLRRWRPVPCSQQKRVVPVHKGASDRLGARDRRVFSPEHLYQSSWLQTQCTPSSCFSRCNQPALAHWPPTQHMKPAPSPWLCDATTICDRQPVAASSMILEGRRRDAELSDGRPSVSDAPGHQTNRDAIVMQATHRRLVRGPLSDGKRGTAHARKCVYGSCATREFQVRDANQLA